MSRTGGANGSAMAPESFDEIEQAVMESERGRWFLSEYAKKIRSSETQTLLAAIARLEAALTSRHGPVAQSLVSAIEAKAPPAKIELEQRHLKYFKADEALFEPPPAAKPSPVALVEPPKPEPAKGARLVIRRSGEAAAPAIPEPVPEPSPVAAVQPVAEETPKRRIVIIRHNLGEDIDVPLHTELAASA
jgi:hypothetical protein